MMRSPSGSVVRFIVSAIAIASPFGRMNAQEIAVPRELESKSAAVRVKAFYAVQAAAAGTKPSPMRPSTAQLAAVARQQPALGRALINLLERENAVVAAAAPGSLSADYLGGYHVDLLLTVARMHDPRSLIALLPGLGTSDVVHTTIAGFGEAAVAPIANIIRSSNRNVRLGAVLTMKKMLDNRGATPLRDESVRTLRDVLLGVLGGREDAFTRVSAVEALASLSDEGIRAQMVRVAESDTTTGYAPPGQPTPLPVKAAARKWLAKHP